MTTSSPALSSTESSSESAHSDASAPEGAPEHAGAPKHAQSEHDSHYQSRSSRKNAVLSILESWQVEVLILLMVFADLAVTGCEVGLDNQIFCIEGKVLEVEQHEAKIAGGPVSHVETKALPAWTSGRSQFGRSLLQVQSFAGARRSLSNVTVATTDSSRSPPARQSQRNPMQTADVRSSAASTSIVVGDVRIPVLVHEKQATQADEQVQSSGEAHHDGSEVHDVNVHVRESIVGSKHPTHHQIVCEGHHGPHVVQLEHCFHWIGISILGFFNCEVATKVWVEGWHFWKRPGHVLDFVVVSASLLLELCLPWTLGFFVMTSNVETIEVYADTYSALLLFLRILRIVRLGHGMFTIANTQWKRSAKMKKELKVALDGQEDLRREIEQLQVSRTTKHGGPELVGLGVDRGG